MVSSATFRTNTTKLKMLNTPRGDLTAPDQLPVHLCPNPEALQPAAIRFPMRISPHLLSILRTSDEPLARQFIPDPDELNDPQSDDDPLCEAKQSPTASIVHRYPKRVVFLVSNQCAAHCRFCMRKRHTKNGPLNDRETLNQGLAYIRHNRNINEVILSGGDPLMLDDEDLLEILTALDTMPHVRILRIHTRIPVVWPQRITPTLIEGLSSFHPLYINLHVNHPDELTAETVRTCESLANAGIPLGSQTVLLRNINDNCDVLSSLFERLLQIRIRPYYLHQIDHVPGTAHFRVPLERGLALMQCLRGQLSGMAMPHFMVDLPGGGGKVELLPDSIVDKQPHHWTIQSFNGRQYRICSG